MATALVDIFGSDIKVVFQPRKPLRQFTSYAGGHGLTSMQMGSAGYPLIVSGTLRVSGSSYDAARQNMVLLIRAIESISWAPEETYTYRNEVYQYMVFEGFRISGGNLDKLLGYDSREQTGFVPFTAHFRSLL